MEDRNDKVICLSLCVPGLWGTNCRAADNAAGETGSKQYILVAYASKHGSTRQVAQEIGKTLTEEGATVDVLEAKDVKDVSRYSAAVIGSAVYGGKWMREAIDLIKNNRETLNKMPVAYFVVCMKMREDTEKNRKTAEGYAKSARELVKPVEIGLFAGAFDP